MSIERKITQFLATVLLLAVLVVPAAAGPMYMTFGTSTDSYGTATGTVLASPGSTFTTYLYVAMDTAAGTNWTYTTGWLSWDTRELTLTDSQFVLPPGATADGGIALYYGTADVNKGVWAGQQGYNPYPKMQTSQVFSYTFQKLTGNSTTITLKGDTTPGVFTITGSNIADDVVKETCPYAVYSLNVSSYDTTPPTITAPTVGTLINNETSVVSGITVYDSAANTGNTSCSMWVHAGTSGSWQAVTATQTSYSGTTAVFSCTIPAAYIATPYIYYFLSATDSWGNNAKYPAGSNFTDTTNATQQTVYSNVPLTTTGLGDTTGFADSRPATVQFATAKGDAMAWIYTAADTVYILRGTVNDTVCTYTNSGGTSATTLMSCTLPLTAAVNTFVAVGRDGVMPWNRTETFTVLWDTGAPVTGVFRVNNATAAKTNVYGCSVYVPASSDTGSGMYRYMIDACTNVYGFRAWSVDFTVTGSETGSIWFPNIISDSHYVFLYAVAVDSAGNYDTTTAQACSVAIDTTSPVIFDHSTTTGMPVAFTLPTDSGSRTGDSISVQLWGADTVNVAAAYIYYRHPAIGVSSWESSPFTYLGAAMGTDWRLYGCSIPAHVVGPVGTNDATSGIQYFIYATDLLGHSTWIDSRGVTLNDTWSTPALRMVSGYDTFTAADSVYIGATYITSTMLQGGVSPRALNWRDTVYVSATDTVYVRINSNADTVRISGQGSRQYDTFSMTVGTNNWNDTLGFPVQNGRNVFRLIGYDAVEPTRDGVNDTITIIIDTYVPVVHSVTIETGSTGMDSGANPTLFVRVSATDTLGYDTSGIGGITVTPDTLIISDTYYPVPQLLATIDSIATRVYVKQAFGSGIASVAWTVADTSVYRLYAYVIDRANNVSALAVSDDLNHDTLGPQVTYTGVPDNRAATQPVTVSLTVTDAGGSAFIDKVWLTYRHPAGYPTMNTWEETVCAFQGGNTWQGTIPSYAVGGIADTTAGVQYFIRTRDSIGNFAYWGVPTGASGGALGMYDTTVTDTTAGDALFKTAYYYDTFSVVLSVPVTTYIWDSPAVTLNGGLTRVGFDTRAIAGGIYVASDSIVFLIGSGGVADTFTIYNAGVQDTITWDSVGTTATGDTRFRLPLKAGVNTIIITATDTDMPAFWSSYTITADTSAPVLTGGYLSGRIHYNPVTDSQYTDSTSFYANSALQDSTSVAYLRMGENAAFTAGPNTAWQTYATTAGYTYAAQDTVPFYYQFRDAAGNMTAVLLTTVQVDTQGPQTALTAAINDSRTYSDTLTFSVTLRDETGDTPTHAGVRAYVWYSNPNQYGGGITQSTSVKWDSQPAVYSTGITWSCSIPASVIGAVADSSVAWFLQAYDTFSKASYLIGQGGTSTYCYTETMTLAQALASPDTFTTVDKVVISTYLRDANDTLAGQVLAYSGRAIDSDVLYLRFLTDADTVTVYLTNDVAKCDSVASASNPAVFVPGNTAQQDTVTITGRLRPGINYVYVRATDGDYPAGNDTYIIVCDTVAPAVGTLTLADNDRGNYVAADTLALRAWFAGGDSTTAIGSYRWSATSPVSSAWASFVSPATTLSETVSITLPSGGTTLTVYWQVQDTAGNISDTFTDTILYDTQAPQFVYTGVADSRAAGYLVNVMPAIDDLSGTAAITAYLYFRHDTGSSTWDSVTLGYTNNTIYYSGDIPSGVVGSSPDSTYPMNEYVLAAKDWFDQWRYFGSNADTSFASLAAAQAKPDSFTTVDAIALSVYATNTAGVDTQAMADSIYVDAGGLTLRVISPNADTITIAHYHAQNGWTRVDTFVRSIASGINGDTFQPVTRLAAGINVFVIIAEDTAAQAEPTARATYAVYVDTYAPFLVTNVLTAGDTMRIDTDLVTTPDTYVVLYLNLTDTDNNLNVPGAVQYFELSETNAFNDSAATGKLAYTPLYTYGFRNADGDSMLTVYLRCWDYAGNTSPVAVRSIYWDTAAPAITFTAITDSKPTSRAVQVSATVTDLSGTATVGIVTYHPTTQSGWETWAMSPSGPNTFTGAVPDTVVGSSASLTGVRYYLAATDSWGQTKYWIDNGVVTTRECTSVVYARTLWYDTFTVSLPVTTAASARDLDTGYVTLVSYGSGWTPVYYRTDSFSVKVTTNADSLAVYIYNSARQLVTKTDTFWLAQGAVNQDTVIYLGAYLLDDTTFIQVYAFDYTVPSNIDTFAVYGDTRVPYFGTAALIDGGLYATGDTSVVVAFAAADTYSVAYVIVSETHPMFMTDTETRKVAYTTSVNYTLTKDTQVATIYVAAFDTAGNMTVSLDQIWLDTFAPFIYFNGVEDSRSTSQRVAVQATIADTSGTVPVVTLYYQDSTSTWGSTAMTAQVGGTYLGYIPANIVGSDTAFRPRYVIVATDTFSRTTYWGANGDSSFTTLAAAQAKPDSFSLVAPVPTTVTIKDGNDTVALTIAYSGQVFNSATLGLVITTSADTLAISIKQSGQADSYVGIAAANGIRGDSLSTFGVSPVSCTFPVVWHTAICTFTVTVTAGDSDGGSPQFQNSWDIVVDTQAPRFGSARIGSSAALDTYIGSVSQNVAFIAQDSYAVSTVCFYGDVTTGTSAYTGAAQAVSFTAGEGWKQLFHYYTDGAGNYSQVFGDTFYLDATSGTVTISPAVLSTATAVYTCSGTVVDNRIDTPATVTYRLNGTDTISATVTQSSGVFTGNLVLTRGVNTIRVTATDSAGNSAYDELTVTYADAVATVVAGTTPVSATMSETGSSLLSVNFGTSDSATLIITSVSGNDTLMATIDFKLPGYTVTVERLDTGTIATSLGASSSLNGITSTNYAALDSFIVKFTATDSQGNPVADNSSAPYDGITLTWTYGSGISAADEASLHVFYFDPADSLWKQATTVSGLTTTWPDGTSGEKQSLINDTIGIRVTHLSIWGVFVGGAPVAANLDNVQIFPNPFKPYDGNAATGQPYDGNVNGMTGIRFINLAAGTEIKIYTINGELVDEVTMVANQGMAVWDARNKGGDELASGIYLVVLRANGQTVVKKVAIIR